jgi:hypothetical protein
MNYFFPAIRFAGNLAWTGVILLLVATIFGIPIAAALLLLKWFIRWVIK